MRARLGLFCKGLQLALLLSLHPVDVSHRSAFALRARRLLSDQPRRRPLRSLPHNWTWRRALLVLLRLHVAGAAAARPGGCLGALRDEDTAGF
jgi:hypothetical protein